MTTATLESISPDHLVGGARRPGRRSFSVTSPVTGQHLMDVARGDADDVAAAVAAAREAFRPWVALGPEARREHLDRLADAVEAHGDELSAIEALDAGFLESRMREHMVPRAAQNIRFFAQWACESADREWRSNACENRVLRSPAGVAALITPWNAPLMLTTWKLGPALAAGCTVVVKPAEWAPLTASRLADLTRIAGLPRGVVNVVQGIGEEAGAALCAHPGVDRISFTGSPETGRTIAAVAARRLVPVSLELGGKSPLLVFEDADLELAVATALRQFDHAGQICLAGTRLLVSRAVRAEFCERLLGAMERLQVGDPRAAGTDVGPLIHRDHFARVTGFVDRARADGARVVAGGRPWAPGGGDAGAGLYYEPTLLTDVRTDMEICQREVFGPVLTLQEFADEAEAVELANATEYGLAAIAFTNDQDRVRRLGSEIVAGTIWINCYFVRDLSAPFGGCRSSGLGREGGDHSLDFFSDVKTVTWRPAA